MAFIPTPFTITVDGKPVGNPEGDEDRIQAKAGSQPAVFSLREGRLQSGNWFLGRSAIEDLSLMPKRVYWFKVGSGQDDAIRRVDARPNRGSYELQFEGAPLVILDGNLFATLLPEPRQPVQVNLQ